MTDFGIPFINDKNLFAAVQQARRLIVEIRQQQTQGDDYE